MHQVGKRRAEMLTFCSLFYALQLIGSVVSLTKVRVERDTLEVNIPGVAGQDYTIYNEVPKNSFSCKSHEYPGYYADTEVGCQVFHVCQQDGKKDSFLCPNGTVLNQQYFVCDWWYNFNCASATQYYVLNANLYKNLGERLSDGVSQVLDPSFLRSPTERTLTQPPGSATISSIAAPSIRTKTVVLSETVPKAPMATSSDAQGSLVRQQPASTFRTNQGHSSGAGHDSNPVPQSRLAQRLPPTGADMPSVTITTPGSPGSVSTERIRDSGGSAYIFELEEELDNGPTVAPIQEISEIPTQPQTTSFVEQSTIHHSDVPQTVTSTPSTHFTENIGITQGYDKGIVISTLASTSTQSPRTFATDTPLATAITTHTPKAPFAAATDPNEGEQLGYELGGNMLQLGQQPLSLGIDVRSRIPQAHAITTVAPKATSMPDVSSAFPIMESIDFRQMLPTTSNRPEPHSSTATSVVSPIPQSKQPLQQFSAEHQQPEDQTRPTRFRQQNANIGKEPHINGHQQPQTPLNGGPHDVTQRPPAPAFHMPDHVGELRPFKDDHNNFLQHNIQDQQRFVDQRQKHIFNHNEENHKHHQQTNFDEQHNFIRHNQNFQQQQQFHNEQQFIQNGNIPHNHQFQQHQNAFQTQHFQQHQQHNNQQQTNFQQQNNIRHQQMVNFGEQQNQEQIRFIQEHNQQQMRFQQQHGNQLQINQPQTNQQENRFPVQQQNQIKPSHPNQQQPNQLQHNQKPNQLQFNLEQNRFHMLQQNQFTHHQQNQQNQFNQNQQNRPQHQQPQQNKPIQQQNIQNQQENIQNQQQNTLPQQQPQNEIKFTLPAQQQTLSPPVRDHHFQNNVNQIFDRQPQALGITENSMFQGQNTPNRFEQIPENIITEPPFFSQHSQPSRPNTVSPQIISSPQTVVPNKMSSKAKQESPSDQTVGLQQFPSTLAPLPPTLPPALAKPVFNRPSPTQKPKVFISVVDNIPPRETTFRNTQGSTERPFTKNTTPDSQTFTPTSQQQTPPNQPHSFTFAVHSHEGPQEHFIPAAVTLPPQRQIMTQLVAPIVRQQQLDNAAMQQQHGDFKGIPSPQLRDPSIQQFQNQQQIENFDEQPHQPLQQNQNQGFTASNTVSPGPSTPTSFSASLFNPPSPAEFLKFSKPILPEHMQKSIMSSTTISPPPQHMPLSSPMPTPERPFGQPQHIPLSSPMPPPERPFGQHIHVTLSEPMNDHQMFHSSTGPPPIGNTDRPDLQLQRHPDDQIHHIPNREQPQNNEATPFLMNNALIDQQQKQHPEFGRPLQNPQFHQNQNQQMNTLQFIATSSQRPIHQENTRHQENLRHLENVRHHQNSNFDQQKSIQQEQHQQSPQQHLQQHQNILEKPQQQQQEEQQQQQQQQQQKQQQQQHHHQQNQLKMPPVFIPHSNFMKMPIPENPNPSTFVFIPSSTPSPPINNHLPHSFSHNENMNTNNVAFHQNNQQQFPPIFIPKTQQKPALSAFPDKRPQQHQSISAMNIQSHHNNHQDNFQNNLVSNNQQGQKSIGNPQSFHMQQNNGINERPFFHRRPQRPMFQNFIADDIHHGDGHIAAFMGSDGYGPHDESNYVSMQKDVAVLRYK